MIWEIWVVVPVIYGVFAVWYFNWKGKLSKEEVDAYTAAFEAADGGKYTSVETFRRFLEADDGKEFVMLNLIKLHEGNIADPQSGELKTARAVIMGYFKPFALALLKRAGHPVMQATFVGGQIDSWNHGVDKDLKSAAMMRYRSRRDLAEMVLNTKFDDIHVYKLAAIEKTTNFPTQIAMSTSMRPGLAVLILLLLLASITQNILHILG